MSKTASRWVVSNAIIWLCLTGQMLCVDSIFVGGESSNISIFKGSGYDRSFCLCCICTWSNDRHHLIQQFCWNMRANWVDEANSGRHSNVRCLASSVALIMHSTPWCRGTVASNASNPTLAHPSRLFSFCSDGFATWTFAYRSWLLPSWLFQVRQKNASF